MLFLFAWTLSAAWVRARACASTVEWRPQGARASARTQGVTARSRHSTELTKSLFLTKADTSKYGSIVRIRPFHDKPGFRTLDPYS